MSRTTLLPEIEWTSYRSLLKSLQSAWSITLFILISLAVLDPENVVGVLLVSLKSLSGTLIYIEIAVSLIALLKATGAESYVLAAFIGRETKAISLCSTLWWLGPVLLLRSNTIYRWRWLMCLRQY